MTVTSDEFKMALLDVQAKMQEHDGGFEASHPGHPWGLLTTAASVYTIATKNDPGLICSGLLAWYIVGYELGRQQTNERSSDQ